MNKPQPPLPLENFQSEAAVWRPIHYLGSKLRLVDAVRSALDQVDPMRGPVVDLFAGSGTVSAALASTRDVIAVDIQEYSRVLCSAVLSRAEVPSAMQFLEVVDSRYGHNIARAASLIAYEESCLTSARQGDYEPIVELIDHASLVSFRASRPVVRRDFASAQEETGRNIAWDGAESRILRFYGGLFFSYRQSAYFDALLATAYESAGPARDVLLAAIVSTASDLVNTVGKHFAQPIRPRTSEGKPKAHLIGKILRDRDVNVSKHFVPWLDRYRSLPKSERSHCAVRADYVDALAQIRRKIGAVYADPPYTRDHYSRFYHVLETMCLGDDPGVSTTRIRAADRVLSRGMYRADRHQSPFCIKSKAPEAFRQLFAAVRRLEAPLVLSYSPYAAETNAHPRVLTVEQIKLLAREYFDQVETLSTGKFSHMKLNASRLHIDAATEAELLFLCR